MGQRVLGLCPDSVSLASGFIDTILVASPAMGLKVLDNLTQYREKCPALPLEAWAVWSSPFMEPGLALSLQCSCFSLPSYRDYRHAMLLQCHYYYCYYLLFEGSRD